ncbi:MAG: 4Fe-4S cluster-binding domain-containing protein [Deltaproteobacteria bacterium]
MKYKNLERLQSLMSQRGIQHPLFGDLLLPSAVQIEKKGVNGAFWYREYAPTLIHLTITGRCYACCKGCINAAITTPCKQNRAEKAPIADAEPERDAKAIVNLLQEHSGDEGVVCFYGGEPLLAPQAIWAVMERISEAKPTQTVRYMLYTNGDLLQKTVAVHPDLIKRLWLISVSIDGRQQQHDRIRLGTSLEKIHRGLAAVATLPPRTVLMWSTLREEQSLADCFAEFLELYNRGQANQFFWHWVETEEPFADIERYALQYESDLKTVMEAYVHSLQKGVVLPLVHVNELVLFALSGRVRNSSACGVELSENYDLIDGKIHSCADLPPELAIGTIDREGSLSFLPHDLSGLVSYKNSLGCRSCGVHPYCGGRCPVQAHAGSAERLLQYCQLMRLHVGIVLSYLQQVVAAMELHGISAQRLYDESAVFAQFTDVTP